MPITHLIDHCAAATAKLDLFAADQQRSLDALFAARIADCARRYDRARDLPGMLPRWKFLQDAIEGRSSTLAIIEKLDDAIACERRALTHWTRDGDTSRIFNLRVARAGEMLAMQVEVA